MTMLALPYDVLKKCFVTLLYSSEPGFTRMYSVLVNPLPATHSYISIGNSTLSTFLLNS